MPNASPYRSLPAAQRQALLVHDLSTNRESRTGFIRAIVARGGGFRPSKLKEWPAAQLAREIMRQGVETIQDEVRLLVALYVEIQPEIQTLFLDVTGAPHEGASIPEDATPPFADAA